MRQTESQVLEGLLNPVAYASGTRQTRPISGRVAQALAGGAWDRTAALIGRAL